IAIRHEAIGTKGGWLVGRVSLEELWRMVDRIRVGDHGVALVVDDQGRLLAHGDPDEKSSVARGDKMSSHPLIAQLTREGPNGSNTAGDEYTVRRGAVLGVAARVPDLGWTVIVE